MTAPGASDTDRYIQSASVDGKGHAKTYLTTAEIRKARTLSFTVGAEPSDWGTGASAAPPSIG